MMLNKYHLIFICTFLFAACAGEQAEKDNETNIVSGNVGELLEPIDYVGWVQNPENGLKMNKVIDDIQFSVQYKPYEYIVCMEERTPSVQDSLLKRKFNELSEMQYFDLTISLVDGAGELLKYRLNSGQQYSERVNYFSFAMQKDIVLVDGKDTIPCELYHFERAYDVMPSGTFLLGFGKKNETLSSSKTLVLYDRVFGKGTIKLTIDKERIKNTPKLKTI